MKFYAFPVSREDAEKNPIIAGFGYIKEHQDQLVEYDALTEVNTYDRGTTHIVIDDNVYVIHKDYVDLTNNRRIYLVIAKDYGSDC